MRLTYFACMVLLVGCRHSPLERKHAFVVAQAPRTVIDRSNMTTEPLQNTVTIDLLSNPLDDSVVTDHVNSSVRLASNIVMTNESTVTKKDDTQVYENEVGLSLEALVTLALVNNPTIPQASALVTQQQGLTEQAGLYPNPQLGYLRSDPSQSDKSRTSGAFLSQEFVTAGKLRLAQLAGRYDIKLREWQVSAQEQRVVNDVRIRYFELVGAQRSLQVIKELVHSAEDGIVIASALVEARQGTKPDELLAEMQRSLATGMEKNANYRIEAARRSLANAIGIELLPAGNAVDSQTRSRKVLEWDKCLEQLYASSPLLQSQRAELDAARTEIQLSQAQAIPNVTVQMVAQRDTTERYNNLGILVAAPVPIFNRNQGNIRTAYGILTQQCREYERLKLAMADQLNTSFQRYQSLFGEVERLESEVIPRADENLKLTMEAFRAGRLDFARVIEAKKILYQSKLACIEADIELQKSLIEIEGLQLTGGLNPTEVGTALQSTPGLGGNGTRGTLLQQLESQKNSSTRNLPGAVQGGDF